jgi:hypothetical protein
MTLEELLSLPNEAFVRLSYELLLGRAADLDGLRHYTRKLALGHSKTSVLEDLTASTEGRAVASGEDGRTLAPASYQLREEIESLIRQARRQNMWWRRFLRPSPLELQVQVLANRIDELVAEMRDQRVPPATPQQHAHAVDQPGPLSVKPPVPANDTLRPAPAAQNYAVDLQTRLKALSRAR